MKKQTSPFIYADASSKEVVDEGVTRQFLGYGPDLMAVKVWFEEGAVGHEHSHHHTQITYVESGEFEVVIDGEKKLLKRGDSFYIEPQKSHGAVCKKAGILIDVFSPVREDFLGDNNENK